MKKKLKKPKWLKIELSPVWFILKLAGLFFAAYSAYYFFVIIKNGSVLTEEEKAISVFIGFLFAVLTGFALTSDVNVLLFLMIRRRLFLAALAAIFVMKLRMVIPVIEYLDFSETQTILYGVSYFLTQAALLILLIYYAFIRKKLPIRKKASVILPASAIVLFLSSFVLDMILFFGYNILLEASPLRTMVIRPIFYLGFIGLSLYFLLTPKKPPKKTKK